MVGADQLGWRTGLALVGLGELRVPPRALGLHTTAAGSAELRPGALSWSGPLGPGPEEKAGSGLPRLAAFQRFLGPS